MRLQSAWSAARSRSRSGCSDAASSGSAAAISAISARPLARCSRSRQAPMPERSSSARRMIACACAGSFHRLGSEERCVSSSSSASSLTRSKSHRDVTHQGSQSLRLVPNFVQVMPPSAALPSPPCGSASCGPSPGSRRGSSSGAGRRRSSRHSRASRRSCTACSRART